MNLDLVTNGAVIKNSLNSLMNGKISWIVLGYSANNSLNVIETGDDSFEDMFDEFDSNKIMYGFAAVTDQNTKLKKNVFIYWQGEAASQSMKTISVQHSNVIRDLCKPVHVTVNARDLQDLDLKEIMTKVASASGSNYSCHNETKQVFQHTASVKSEENTASNIRQNRLKELSALGSIQKEPVPVQKIGSTYEKVDAMKEIKNLRSTKVEENNPPKPKVFAKIDANKGIKSSYSPFQNEVTSNKGSNYTKIDASKEIRSNNNVPPQTASTGYKKINPEQELKSLNHNQKNTYENKAKVQSENNTAQKAKEERQKELSSIFNRKISCDDELDSKVGTNYSKVNPMAEIKKLRSESITHDDNVFSNQTSNYKKLDPSLEIQKLRGLSSSDSNEPVSPVSNYKKINPAEEIKKLRSQSTFSDVQSSNHGYKKIDPKEEISNARKLSTPFINTENVSIETRSEDKDVDKQVKRTSMFSARQTFENAHKINHDVHQPHNFQTKILDKPVTQQKVKVEPVSYVDHKKVDNIQTPPATVKETPRSVVQDSKHLKNTAEAQFAYEATDSDEISFVEGEIIREIEIIDEDWWIGVNASGQKGMFPSNYVMYNNDTKKEVPQIITPEAKVEKVNIVADIKVPKVEDHPHVETNDSLTAIAIFQYQANDGDEISFEVDDIIKKIEQVDDGWWVGINPAGQKGMFPSNFVELNSAKQKDNVSSPLDEYNIPFSEHSHEDTVKVHALFDYCAQDDDELSFKAGDILGNVSKIDEGWWEGELPDGKRGLFPSNYVETI